MYPEKNSKNNLLIIISVVIVAIGSFFIIYSNLTNKQQSSFNSGSTISAANKSSSILKSIDSNTGIQTLNITQNYQVPEGGQNTLKLTINLENGIIKDSSASNTSTERQSEQYDQRFESSYKSKIIGKKLADISDVYVSGASLTTGAFQAAVAKLQSQNN